MKKIYIILRNIFLLSFVAFIYYIARPEIKPREILSSVRSLFETKEETDLREIREAMECKPDKPLSVPAGRLSHFGGIAEKAA